MAPHWLRFARALALVGGVAACGGAPADGHGTGGATNGTTTSGGATGGTGSSGTGSSGTGVNAGGPVVTASDPCPCTCDSSSTNPPYCGAVGHWDCCEPMVIEGPLPPPDLPT